MSKEHAEINDGICASRLHIGLRARERPSCVIYASTIVHRKLMQTCAQREKIKMYSYKLFNIPDIIIDLSNQFKFYYFTTAPQLPACLPKSIVWTVPHSLASLPLIVVRFLPSASPLNFCLSPSLAIHLSASPSRHVARSETYMNNGQRG